MSKYGIESLGKIVSYESSENGNKTPVIAFQTADGKKFIGKPFIHASSSSDRLRSYEKNINKEIKIRYNAYEPENFIIKEKSYAYVVLFLAIIGLITIVLSIGNLLGYNKFF